MTESANLIKVSRLLLWVIRLQATSEQTVRMDNEVIFQQLLTLSCIGNYPLLCPQYSEAFDFLRNQNNLSTVFKVPSVT